MGNWKKLGAKKFVFQRIRHRRSQQHWSRWRRELLNRSLIMLGSNGTNYDMQVQFSLSVYTLIGGIYKLCSMLVQRNERSPRTRTYAWIPQEEQVKSQESIICRYVGYTIILGHLLTAYCLPCLFFVHFVAEPLDEQDIDLEGRLSRKISLNGFDESSSIAWIRMSVVFWLYQVWNNSLYETRGYRYIPWYQSTHRRGRGEVQHTLNHQNTAYICTVPNARTRVELRDDHGKIIPGSRE